MFLKIRSLYASIGKIIQDCHIAKNINHPHCFPSLWWMSGWRATSKTKRQHSWSLLTFSFNLVDVKVRKLLLLSGLQPSAPML